jgi:hypothetical protein
MPSLLKVSSHAFELTVVDIQALSFKYYPVEAVRNFIRERMPGVDELTGPALCGVIAQMVTARVPIHGRAQESVQHIASLCLKFRVKILPADLSRATMDTPIDVISGEGTSTPRRLLRRLETPELWMHLWDKFGMVDHVHSLCLI